eukprot:CAMPEP_0177636892 /NCGR_PEP_ID=MMETSP0447-20121125/4681_1 /TAXON_ID=0 /ORGANISM="Stygamoeba regulata, Strain BSH-02190019" /LENGTH=280 /DNA_ID=CAMNT_0019138785 /DNA_START=133 /DNA_END=975 /DNA_ORIENTATION=+
MAQLPLAQAAPLIQKRRLYLFDEVPEKSPRILDSDSPSLRRRSTETNTLRRISLDKENQTNTPVETFLQKKKSLRGRSMSLLPQLAAEQEQEDKDVDVDVVSNTLFSVGISELTLFEPLPICGYKDSIKLITPHTVADLLSGKYSNHFDSLEIIDCRYAYEFEGGHIRGAQNVYVMEEFKLTRLLPMLSAPTRKRRVLFVFHCEFSSERAPRMCRFARKWDRSVNQYPALHFPHMYVMEGGYKAFFNLFKAQCQPEGYVQMKDPLFKTERKKFKQLSGKL